MKKRIAGCLIALSVAASAQSRYVDPQHRVAFKYPKSWIVKEGGLGEEEGLGGLGLIPMSFVVPGGERIVTVEAPENAYPGTDLANAFVTVSENPYLTADECRQFSDDQGNHLARRIGKISFLGVGIEDAAMGRQFGGEFYHAYLNGACFEVGMGKATAGLGAVDGLRRYPEKKVDAILERILRSMDLHPPRAVWSGRPAIRGFEITAIDPPKDLYRISWDVEGSEPGSIWLTTQPYVQIEFLAPETNGETREALRTDTPNAIGFAQGSMNVEIRNCNGDATNTAIRLFVAGAEAIANQVTVAVPPAPCILGVESGARPTMPGSSGQDAGFQVMAGQMVVIQGFGLEGNEVGWLGATKIELKHLGPNRISFIVPKDMSDGEYELSLSNEHGRGGTLRIQVVAR